MSTRIFGFYGIPHLNLSVCVNDNFDRHTNRFENNISQECKEPKKSFSSFEKNLQEKLEISLVGAPLQLFRGSSKTVVEPSMNDCFGVDFSKRAFTTSTNCR